MSKEIRAICPQNYPVGRAWVALDAEGRLIEVIEAIAPKGVTFEAFRDDSKARLRELGKYAPGNIVYEDGVCWFISLPKTTHEGRRRKKTGNEKVI